MSITQISMIQVRRGLQQDLPQLAGGEFGWSVDTQRLYIGNGTFNEGAPVQGVTEVLTQYSNFFSSTIKYTFAGTSSGYTSQTGASQTTPIQQSLQDVLDQFVSIKDFGAKGDGVTDDTIAINRAIQQIYVSSLNGTYNNVRRAIKLPAGTYKVTGTILLPPNCYLYGDGKNNTFINATATSAFVTCDSLFQTGSALGINGAILPKYITLLDLAIQSPTTVPVVSITAGTSITFDRIQFTGGTYSMYVTGASDNVSMLNSTFSGYVIAPTYIDPTVTGVVYRSNAFGTTQLPLLVGSTTITSLTNGAGEIKYQLLDSTSNYRFGYIKYNVSNGVCSFVDEFTEPAVSLSANLHINATGVMSCTVTNASTLKYSLTQFT